MPLDFGSLTSPSVPIAAAAGATGAGLPQPNIAALSLPGFGDSVPGMGAAAPSGAPSSAPGAAPPPAGQSMPLSQVVQSGGTDVLVNQIITREGRSPQGVLNNPGNIKFVGAPGQTDSGIKATDGGTFASYQTPQAGRDAIVHLIKTAAMGGSSVYGASPTVGSFMSTYGGESHAGASSGYAQDKADIRAQESEINKKIGDLAEKIGSLDARDPASLKELAHYREEMEKYQQQALQISTHPPQFNPGQSMQQQGGMALIIGMLGGLLTKRPLIASLNAGAAAMNAYNKGDQQEYQRNLDQWKVSTDAMFKMAEFEHQMYADTLKDEKLSEGEKLDKIQAQASLLGNQRMLLASQSQGLDQVQANQRSYDAMMLKYQAAVERGAGIEKAGNYSVTTPDGKTTPMSLEQGKKPGEWFSSSTGQLMNFPEGTTIDPISAGAGRQEATQINAMVGSSNEAVVDLRNLMELPIGATSGAFMGVQTEAPSELGEALKRTFASNLTSEESKDLLVTAQGIQREIAIIEAQGRATGLVGLQTMANALIPQEGDPGPVVMRKYAQIRQILEQNIETITSRTNIDPKQKALLEKNLEQIKSSVPFTVHDVNTLERAINGGADDETVGEYAKRMFGDDKGTTPDASVVIQNGSRFDAKTHQYLGPAQ